MPMPAATLAERRRDGHGRDAEQMARVAGGDAVAFAELHTEHYPAVFRLAMATLLDRDEARDVTQEVFVLLHAIAPRWEPRAALRTWLHRTTVNVATSARRRLLRWLRPRASIGAMAMDPEALASADRTAARIGAAMTRLSPQQRAVTSLHLDAELEPREIAEQLGITANAARVSLHKGLERLRVAMRDAEPDTTEERP